MPAKATPTFPLILDSEQLEPRLGEKNFLVVDLCKPEYYASFHVPGALHLDYARLTEQGSMARGLLPDDEHLAELFSSLGLTPETHVVAYDDEGGGKAGRLLWTLDAIGHRSFSLLNGGLQAWHNEGHTGSSKMTAPPAKTAYEIEGKNEKTAVADTPYVLAHLDDPHTVILDVRSANEYLGLTRTALRNGHMPGAVNLDWSFAMDFENNLKLRPKEELEIKLHRLGITPDKEVIVHCHTHHRSAFTYVVLKALGYPRVRGYAGSWSEWGNREDTPVTTGLDAIAA
ncbi:MAG: sulfurtransferase [Betaproteobacteria bacterium]|nr:sulfurtransferase [Betaproteobacteria bacterium]